MASKGSKAEVEVPYYGEKACLVGNASIQDPDTPIAGALSKQEGLEAATFLADHTLEMAAQREKVYWEAFFVVMPLFWCVTATPCSHLAHPTRQRLCHAVLDAE